MNTAAFWIATLERAVRTFAQALLAILGADGLGIADVDWGDALSASGLAALAAVLTAVVTSGGTHGPGITEAVRRSGP